MYKDKKGPINAFSWGKCVVNQKEHSANSGKGKDILLVGEKVYRWKERKGHELKKKMIKPLFDHDVDVLVIGNGVEGLIYCNDKLIEKIKEKGIKEVYIEKTPSACELYNRLYRKGKKAALLAHGTC